jgi:hypothetical protein
LKAGEKPQVSEMFCSVLTDYKQVASIQMREERKLRTPEPDPLARFGPEPTILRLKLNASFLPANMLEGSGNAALETTMCMNGTTSIRGIGDVGSSGPKQITDTDSMIKHLAEAVESVLLKNEEFKEYKLAGPKISITMGCLPLGNSLNLNFGVIWLRVKKGEIWPWIMRRDMWMETS